MGAAAGQVSPIYLTPLEFKINSLDNQEKLWIQTGSRSTSCKLKKNIGSAMKIGIYINIKKFRVNIWLASCSTSAHVHPNCSMFREGKIRLPLAIPLFPLPKAQHSELVLSDSRAGILHRNYRNQLRSTRALASGPLIIFYVRDLKSLKRACRYT